MRSQGNDADDPKAQIKKFRVCVFFYVPAPLYTSKKMPVITTRAPMPGTMSEAAVKSFLVSHTLSHFNITHWIEFFLGRFVLLR